MLTFFRFAPLVAIGLLWWNPAWAGGVDPSLVPRDAAVVLHVDADAVRTSPLLASLSKESLDQRLAEAAAELAKEGIPITERDLKAVSGITFWSEAGKDEVGALIVTGLSVELAARALATVDGYHTKTERGRTLHCVVDDGETACLAGSGKTLVLADSAAGLHRTLDTIAKKSPSIAGTPAAKRLPRSRSMLILAVLEGPAMKKIAKEADSPVFRNLDIVRAALQVGEKSRRLVGRLSVEAADAKAASELEQLARGALSLLSLAADEPGARRLVQGISVAVRGNTVSLDVEIPADLLREMVANR